MIRRIGTAIVCVMIGLLLPARAQAKDIRQNQVMTGVGVLLDESNVDFSWEFKGVPGRASGRSLLKLGATTAPSGECAGFDFEQRVVGGALGEIFNNFSKLFARTESGVVCANVGGAFVARISGSYVGGVGFPGASGTFSIDLRGQEIGVLMGYPAWASASGSMAGTITIPR